MELGAEFWVRAAVLLSLLLITVLASGTPEQTGDTPTADEDLLYALSFWC